MKKLFLVLWLVASLLGGQSVAQEKGPEDSTGGGNGGCSICQQSYELGLEIAAELLIMGNDKVRKKVPLLKDVMDFYEKALARRVEPGLTRELGGREALSFKEKSLTLIDKDGYSKLPYGEKRALEIHEIFVLLGIEREGVYIWSSRVKELFPNYDLLEKGGTEYSCDDEVCLLRYPKVKKTANSNSATDYYINEYSPTQGVCKYYGLGKAFGYSVVRKKVGGKGACRSNLVSSLQLDKRGLEKRYLLSNTSERKCYFNHSVEYYRVYEYIICKKID